jgi:hypothetical protein
MNVTNVESPGSQSVQQQPSEPILSSQLPAEPAQHMFQTYSEPEKKKNIWKIILLTIVGVIVVGVAILGFLIFQGIQDAPEIEKTVTEFLVNVSTSNLEAAYKLTSEDFKKSTPREDFATMLTQFEAQYSGFQDQSQTGFYVRADAGKPTFYDYTGTVTYTDGDSGEVTATLLKENGEWKILGIEISIDANRLRKFNSANSSSVLGVSTEKND